MIPTTVESTAPVGKADPDAVDFYAGGGGASFGLHAAGYNVLAALNHNANCIATHAVNFRQTQHFLADIFKQNEWLIPKAQLGWFSPSCVFHSVARGGQHCNAQERAHAEQIPRFCYAMNLQCVMIENVREIIKWGPLKVKWDKLGQPVTRINKQGELETVLVPDKARQGEYYHDWVRTMKSMGYTNYEYRFLNAADYGTAQSRVRYFGIFTRPGIPIVWPQPTHDREGRGACRSGAAYGSVWTWRTRATASSRG